MFSVILGFVRNYGGLCNCIGFKVCIRLFDDSFGGAPPSVELSFWHYKGNSINYLNTLCSELFQGLGGMVGNSRDWKHCTTSFNLRTASDVKDCEESLTIK